MITRQEDFIRKLIREELNKIEQSHVITSVQKFGSYEGVVHYDIERVKNWFSNRGIDHKKYIDKIQLPAAFLNGIIVDYNLRGLGYGNRLYSQFEEECYEFDVKCIVLESDYGEEQIGGFNLDSWYESFDFEIIGNESGNSIMIKNL